MFAFLLFFLAADPQLLPKDQTAAGWIQLFDGESLFGWTPAPGTAWTATGGVLSAARGSSGWLTTHAAFGDYRLRLEYRVARPDVASAVGLRMGRDGGYVVRIQDTDPKFPTGSIAGRVKAKAPKPESGKWRALDVTVRGTRVTVRLDGRQVSSLKHFGPLHGPVGLQFVEGNPIEFRNIVLKPLDMACLFNGRDLAGWRVERGGNWSVRDGAVHVEGGPGMLESERVWDDFVLQIDVRTNPAKPGDHPNSGLFFRGDRGVFWSGYESQIRNEHEGDDPAKPVDFGTGGIYRSQPARRIVAKDGEWMTKTIAVQGRRISVWVDGFPVTSWEDARAEGLSVRDGKARLMRGTLSLQAHDPGANLDFNNLCIAPLARR